MQQISATEQDIYDLWASSDGVVAVGAGGLVMLSEDDGRTWEPLDAKTQSDLWGVWGRGATDFWVTGRSKTACTLLHRRLSRGRLSFRKEVTRKKMCGSALVGCGDDVLLAGKDVHDAGILRSTDNGKKWTAVASGTVSDIAAHGQVVVASMADSTVMESTNGGADWQTRRLIKGCCHLKRVWFDDGGRAFAAGTASVNAIFRRETDGAWHQLDLPNRLYTHGTYGHGRHWVIGYAYMTGQDASRVWVSKLWTSSDGTSFKATSHVPGTLLSIAVTESGTVITGGLDGLLLRVDADATR